MIIFSPVLYLVPTPIGNEKPFADEAVVEIIVNGKYFVVEELRTACRFIKRICPTKDINICVFREFNEHNRSESLQDVSQWFAQGNSVILMSEAGLPCIADPGYEVVFLAHKMKVKVKPMPVYSSMMMALMASGFNGQRFMFHGYLPVKGNERVKAIRDLEQRMLKENACQIFIETPYRNNVMLKDLLENLKSETYLSVSVSLCTENEYINTRMISEWKKQIPDINKLPAVFIIGV